MKESFILYNSYEQTFQILGPEKGMKLLTAMFTQNRTGETMSFSDPDLQIAWSMISGQMVRDGANYDKKVRAGIASGRRRTKKEQCSNNDPTLPGDTDTEDGYEYETDNENDTDTGVKKQSSRFQKPTVEEVAAFLAEKGYHFQADAFVDYYESNGWMVGKNHMKNWKAACHTWEGKWNVQPSKSQGGTGNYFMDKLMRMKGEEGNEDE